MRHTHAEPKRSGYTTDRFFVRIKEILEEYHRGLKPAGVVDEVKAAVRQVEREGASVMGEVIQFPNARHPQGGLTRRQLQAMQFIVSWRARFGQSNWPSLWSVAEAIGVRSEMGAQRIVRALFDAGAMESPEEMPKGWR